MTDLPALPTGALVRAARRRDGRPQAAVAGLCGISTDYLSQIERGRKKPSGDVLAKLAAELGVAVGTLLGDDDAPAAKTEPAVTGGAAVVQALLQRKDASLRPAPAHECGTGWSRRGRSGRRRPHGSPRPRSSCPA
ncbi:helix-turn-helix domain-containing protein [Streptomyces anulatus]|uniref:helix-turn-helix domain-containing protein n=1 Tax=Streptomyces anulatus TaxID=1892 RepID=UPI00070FC596|nr:helix-turn-helix transcriptional regulator [Streptomyces anulatus]WTC61067.1 helix-turn-helix domain-containing protein [Streptomyces anulatus]